MRQQQHSTASVSVVIETRPEGCQGAVGHTRRPEISLSASAQREVESAIMAML